MALQKQNIFINFAEGIDTKTNAKITTKLLTLENGVFNKGGEIKKRLGYSILSQEIAGSTSTISSGKGLGKFFDELIMYDDDTVYSYSSNNDEWIDKGDLVALKVDREEVIRNNVEQTQPVSAFNAGIAVFAWEDSSGGVRYHVSDNDTDAIYVANTLINNSADTPKVLALGQYLYIFFMDAGNLDYRRISTADPTTLGSQTALKNDSHADHIYGVKKLGNAAIIAYKDTSNVIKYFYMTAEGVEGTALLGYPVITTIAEDPTNALNLTTFSTATTDYIGIAWHSSTNGLKTTIVDRNFTEIVASTVLDSATGAVSSITGCLGATGNITTYASGTVRWFYTVEDTPNPEDTFIKTATIDLASSKSTAVVFKRSVGLASEAFIHDSRPYVNVIHESSLQPTIFTLNQKGVPVSKINPGVAGQQATRPMLTEVDVLSDPNKFLFAASIKGKYSVENQVSYSLLGVSKIELDFSSSNAYRSHNIGNNLSIVGGLLYSYDSVSVTESGFLLYPEGVTAASSAATGSVADGTYQYSVVYEWLDNKGQLHRSAPSIAKSYTESGGTGGVDIVIPTLRVTLKSSPRSEVILAVYRTEDAGTIYYKVSSASAPTYNDPTADSVTFVDTLADASITGNEILYTTGGVLDNISPPTAAAAQVHKNRLFLAGLEEPNLIWYSKEYFSGDGLSFNDALILRVDPKGGEITALASLDDKLIIFKRDNIYGLLGDGPTNSGDNSDYSNPDLITTDVGCTNLNSLALTPQGLMFKTIKGIYLLNRELQITYIGAPVEAFNSNTITSTRLVEDFNEVRFTTSEGTTLVYNYYFNQWSTFTNQASVDSILWNNSYLYLKTNGAAYRETAGTFYDDDIAYKLTIETPWIKIAGLQGFQRVYRASLLGDFKSAHKLKMKVYYDYKNYSNDLYYFDPALVLGSAMDDTYGSDSPYGSGSPYGGEFDDVYQFRVHLGTQKCQSIKFLIEDIQDGSGSIDGESYSIQNMALEVGVKKGLNKLRSLKSL